MRLANAPNTKSRFNYQPVTGHSMQRVGRVGTRQLLAALILESKSWQQVGNADAEFSAGWTEDALTSSLDSLTATTAELRLGRGEKILARMIAVAAVVGAVATTAGAVAAWCNP